MNPIENTFKEQVEFALKVKKYLDSLKDIKSKDLKISGADRFYILRYNHQGMEVCVDISAKEVYEFALTKATTKEFSPDVVNQFIRKKLQNEIAENIL